MTTDKDGRFSVDVAPGLVGYKETERKPSHMLKRESRQLEIKPEDKSERILHLARTQVLRVRLVDKLGEPISHKHFLKIIQISRWL